MLIELLIDDDDDEGGRKCQALLIETVGLRRYGLVPALQKFYSFAAVVWQAPPATLVDGGRRLPMLLFSAAPGAAFVPTGEATFCVQRWRKTDLQRHHNCPPA